MTGLNGALCRAEFLEALVRLSSYCFEDDQEKSDTPKKKPEKSKKKKKDKRSHTEKFEDFCNYFLRPLAEQSDIVNHRKIIRASKGVNELLYTNRESLQAIYTHYRECDGFTLDSACRLLNNASISSFDQQSNSS